MPPLTEQYLDELNYAETRRVTTLPLVPKDEDEKEFEGAIAHVNGKVNFFKRYGYRDNAIGRGLLGQLAKEPFVELTIRTTPDASTGIRFEIEVFVSKALYDSSGAEPDAPVRVTARPMALGPKRLWVANTLWLATS
jgi:hypothetical protein